jgi:type I restriction enzyme S subunit
MELVDLKDVCSLKTGKTPPTKHSEYFNGEINWFTPGDLNKRKVLSKSKRTISNLAFLDRKATIFEKGYLLMTCVGEIGKIGITSEKCSSNQQITALIPNYKIDVNYLFYCIKVQTPFLKSIANNAVVPILNNGKLNQVKIPLPKLATQKKIAAILDEADKLRQLNKQLIVKYDALTQSLFLDMFGDPVTNPKGWEKLILNELVTKLGDGLHGTPNYSDEGEYYFINGNNLIDGKIVVTEKTKKIDSAEYLKIKKDLDKTTMFVSINGTIGKVAFYNGEKIALGKSACYFNIKVDLINKTFLYYIFNCGYFIHYTTGNVTGSTIKNVSLKSMRNFPILFPPIQLQNQFAERVQVIENQKQQAQESLQKSEDLFNSLLQKAFKGELVK